MILGITGARKYRKLEHVEVFLTDVVESIPDIEIIVGEAKGVDQKVREVCLQLNIKFHIYYAEWDIYKEAAGPIRNSKLVLNSDKIIAFWDGKNKHSGTKDCFTKAFIADKLVKVFKDTEDYTKENFIDEIRRLKEY